MSLSGSIWENKRYFFVAHYKLYPWYNKMKCTDTLSMRFLFFRFCTYLVNVVFQNDKYLKKLHWFVSLFDKYQHWEEVFFSIHIHTHVQFEQLHKYIQNRNTIYKKWYSQKQSLDIKLLGISRKEQNKSKETKMGCLAQKVLSHLLL